MNSVSWFIYIAQVSESIGSLFRVLGGLGIILCVLFTMISTISASVDADEFVPRASPARYIAISAALLAVGCLMPERNTMYAIAASEVGEQVVKSEIASDATKALHQWIKKQIEPEKKG
jgi:hypothetical protein